MNARTQTVLSQLENHTADLARSARRLGYELATFEGSAEEAADIDPDFVEGLNKQLGAIRYLLGTVCSLSDAAAGRHFIEGLEWGPGEQAEAVGNLQRMLMEDVERI